MAMEIRVENLHKSFGKIKVLNGVGFSVERGEIVAIIGASGGGKTVLLKELIGEFQPDIGSVWLADHESKDSPLVNLATLDEAGMDRLRIHWAVVFQNNGLLSGTVQETISLPLEWVKGYDEDETLVRVRRAVTDVGLDEATILSTTREHLSGGTAKRVAIARALAMEPMIVFFDEPTTGLDPERAEQIDDLIAKTHALLQEGWRRTYVIITHDIALLHRLKPRIIMLDGGKICFDGLFESFCRSTLSVIQPYLA